MPSVEKWSETAGSNSSSDSDIVAAEGMNPSAVNDSMRAIMAGIARWNNDISGELATAGTSTAYTLTTNQGILALANGTIVTGVANNACGAAPTLNVDALGAKNQYKALATGFTTLVAGDILSGQPCMWMYNAALNGGAGGWLLINPAGSAVTTDATIAALAAVTTAADKLIYATGSDAFTTTDLTAAARSILDDATVGAILTTIGGQAVDTDLTALAGNSTNGLWARTGSGAGSARTITAGAGISVTNGDGVSGNPTIAADFATSAEILANTADQVVGTDEVWAAMAEVTVAYGATPALNFNTFINMVMTLTGNVALATPTNMKAGQSGVIRFVQDGTGSRTLDMTNSAFKSAYGSDIVLSTAAGAVDLISYYCESTSVVTLGMFAQGRA